VPAPHRPGACLNCGSSLVREFCAECGQRNLEVRAPVRELAKEVLEESFSLDSRVARTVVPFLFRPGFLTAEWAAGRRARYSSPLRLYLLASAAFFLVGALQGAGRSEAAGEVSEARERVEAAAEEAAAAREARPAAGARNAMAEGPGDEGHRALERLGAVGRAVEERWRELDRLGLTEASRRIASAFREWVPRVMFFLVPVGALLLELLWRRRWLTEHMVMSLHVHAFAFALLTFAEVMGGAAGSVAFLATVAYLALALRRAYGQRWGGLLLKVPVLLGLYGLSLALCMAGVAALAFFVA